MEGSDVIGLSDDLINSLGSFFDDIFVKGEDKHVDTDSKSDRERPNP